MIDALIEKYGEWSITATPETFLPDWDLSQEETDEILAEAEWNVWAWCCVRVRLSLFGVDFDDYLGGCSYASEEQFVSGGDYYEDMRFQCRKQARKWLARLLKAVADELETEVVR